MNWAELFKKNAEELKRMLEMEGVQNTKKNDAEALARLAARYFELGFKEGFELAKMIMATRLVALEEENKRLRAMLRTREKELEMCTKKVEELKKEDRGDG